MAGMDDLVGVCLQILVCLDSDCKGGMTRPSSGNNAVHLKTTLNFGCTMFEYDKPSVRESIVAELMSKLEC